MLRARLKALQPRLAPAGSRRHKHLRSIWRRLRGGVLWGPPRLTFLLSVDGVDETDAAERAALDATIDSVIAQIDRRWQLVLVGDRADAIRAALTRDSRVEAWTAPGDTAARFNAAAAAARGLFVATLAPGDLLLPDAVRTFARAAARLHADVLYGDEIDYSKPDWSPDLLLAFPYTGRVCAFARDAVARLGGWSAATIAAEDYRLLLAALRSETPVRRLGQIVCRRATPGRDALVTPEAVEARRQALVEHFAAAGETAHAEPEFGPSRLRVVWPIAGQPLVSIVIATRDRLALLRQCIESLEQRSTYPAYEIVIADNDSVEADTLAYFAATRHRVVKVPGPFNFSHINNEGARAARGEFVVFLNNDTQVLARGWIEEMLQQAQRPGVGCVGAQLLFGNGRVQHAGVVLHDGSAFHLAYDMEPGGALWPWVSVVRNTSAVTAACLMIDRRRFLDEGGFDETFPVNYNDVEFCVRLLKRGSRHVYTPYAVLYHHESSSRPRGVAADEGRHLRAVCGSMLWDDPCCPRAEERGTPRWTLDTGAGRTVMRGVNAWSRGWAALRSAGSQPRPLLGVRPLAGGTEGDAIRWLDRVEIEGQIRPALFMHPPATRTWRVAAPRGARLQAWIALMPDVWMQNMGGVRFRATVTRAGAPPRTQVWHIDPTHRRAHRAWVPISFPFHASPDTTVDLTLATEVPRGASPAHAWALWGQPLLVERRPLRIAIGRQIQIVRRLGWRTAARRILAVLRGRAANPFGMYDAWFRNQALAARESRDIPADLARLAYRPRVSVLTPVYNTDPDVLRQMVESVRAQWYPDWQLCLADDASTKAETRAALDEIAGVDPRIRVVRLPVNGGISAATNAALDAADGEFVALLDHDDELAPGALLEVVELINCHRDADVVYTDEDKLDFDGSHVEPFFKPDWSPEYLRSSMFLGHLVVYRRTIVEAAGRFRSAFDGSQDYDLALRVAERTARIHHVPHVLYHWRKVQGSAAATADAKPWGLKAARRALVDHVSRLPVQATVEDEPGDGFWRIRYAISGTPTVSVIVPTAGTIRETPSGRRDMPLACVRSILERTDYPHYEILLAVNGRLSDELTRLMAAEPRIRRFDCERAGPFNFAATINAAARRATGAHLLLLNDDTEVIAGEWMRAMLEFSQQPAIGAVGAKLLFPDGRLQHAGVVVGIGGGACHVYSGHPGDTPGYFGAAWIIRNYSAVTAACMMTRRDVFDAMNGFDERFATDFNDVDYCLRIREAGYRIVWTPFATLHHFEGASFGSRERKVNPQEVRLMSERWGRVIANDPYYNPNLTRTALDYSLRL